MMMMMENMGSMGWAPGFGWIFMFIFLALLITGAITIVKWIFGKTSGTRISTEKNAMEILKERYARDEIGQEEYEQKKYDLKLSL